MFVIYEVIRKNNTNVCCVDCTYEQREMMKLTDPARRDTKPRKMAAPEGRARRTPPDQAGWGRMRADIADWWNLELFIIYLFIYVAAQAFVKPRPEMALEVMKQNSLPFSFYIFVVLYFPLFMFII